jgi:hypothetical protein
MKKVLFRDMMYALFDRLKTPRKRVIAERQIAILNLLLEEDKSLSLATVMARLHPAYTGLKNRTKALIRDLNALLELRAIDAMKLDDGEFILNIRLEWPTEITDTAFFQIIRRLPRARTRLIV